ncbi:hypothetical protein SUDANB105_00390 [Streptomyces sp. enrichment culture]
MDLAGRLLLPAFQDAHAHPVPSGLELTQCDLTEAKTAADTVAAVRACADAHPEREWITGGGRPVEAGGICTRSASPPGRTRWSGTSSAWTTRRRRIRRPRGTAH